MEIGFLDRFTGAVVLTGDVSAVEYALRQVTRTLGELMRFTACPLPGPEPMKRLMLIGPSQCGKTSLTQVLRGETLRYQKTQAIVWTPAAIDTPGISGKPLPVQCTAHQRLRGRCHRAGTKCRCAWSPFSPGFTAPMNRPVIGVITKADLAAPSRLQQVRTWLEAAGAGHIFITSALTGDGLDDLFACLNAEEYQ